MSDIQYFILQTAVLRNDSTQNEIWLAIIHSKEEFDKKEKNKIEGWLKVRMNTEALRVYFE